MMPPAEQVHWWFATGFLLLGLLLTAEALIGPEAWRRTRWRAYLWPGLCFGMGVLMWPVMAFYAESAIHMLAHGSWAEVLMLAGAAELGLARGKLHSRYWRLCTAFAMAVSGVALLIHEQNPWFFERSAFLHRTLGWGMIGGSLFPVAQTFRPRSLTAGLGFAATFLFAAVLLYADRDIAPIFGHISKAAGIPHR